MAEDQWLTSTAAAARLGVKPDTLYSYVSRGMVRSERPKGERRSRFLRADVERLASRQRRGGGRAGALEVIVETELTLLDPSGRLYYRGWDVSDLVAEGISFEVVSSWLWTAERVDVPFVASIGQLAATYPVVRGLSDVPTIDRLRAVIAAVRHADPLRSDLRPAAVADTGRSLIATLVDTMPLVEGATDAPEGASLARRLWPRLTPRRPLAHRVDVLNAALVLLADHELAASTLAARVAASSWADPYLVAQAGLATLGGPLHGAASSDARRLIHEVETGTHPAEAIGRRLRDQQLIPGFGHSIYERRDPRADLLFELLESADQLSPSVGALVRVMDERDLPFPNIDLALAAFAEQHEMIEDAGEVIFAVARIVGWLAHAGEEYVHRLRYRPRAVYVGPEPGEAAAVR